MAVSQMFPASAAKSLVEGYCQDFVELAASLAQTLEQVEMRQLDVEPCREALLRTEKGMRGLADAIHDLLARATAGARAAAQPRAAAVAAPPVAAPAPPPAATPTPQLPGRPAAAAVPAGNPSPRPAVPPAAPPPPPEPRLRPGSRKPQPLAGTGARPQPIGEPKLRGTSESMPVLSVLQFLSRMRKSGTLHLDVDDEHLTFDFVDGLIEASNSNRPLQDERLGSIVLRLFPSQREWLQPFLQRPAERLGVRRLGTELVQQGLLSEGQLMEALEQQVHARFQRVNRATLVHYAFEEGERVPGDGRIRIRPFELAFQSRLQKGS